MYQWTILSWTLISLVEWNWKEDTFPRQKDEGQYHNVNSTQSCSCDNATHPLNKICHVNFIYFQLNLYDIESQHRTTILNYCSYVQVILTLKLVHLHIIAVIQNYQETILLDFEVILNLYLWFI